MNVHIENWLEILTGVVVASATLALASDSVCVAFIVFTMKRIVTEYAKKEVIEMVRQTLSSYEDNIENSDKKR